MGEEPFQQSWRSGCNPWAEDYIYIYEVFYSIFKNCPLNMKEQNYSLGRPKETFCRTPAEGPT